MDAAGNTDAEWATVILRACKIDDRIATRAKLEAIVKEIKTRAVVNHIDRVRLEHLAAEFPETLERLKGGDV